MNHAFLNLLNTFKFSNYDKYLTSDQGHTNPIAESDCRRHGFEFSKQTEFREFRELPTLCLGI